jgi:hypothetical protein
MAYTPPPGHSPKSVSQFNAELQQACDDYKDFVCYVLKPAKNALEAAVLDNKVTLHQAFGSNLIAAHSVDYLQAVRTAAGIEGSRKKLVLTFDEKFAVAGAYLRNRKMELIDAINNGLKHIRLRSKQYEEVIERYGQISFRSLIECDGRVMCQLVEYRFDYCRVVLLPALKALSSWEFNTVEDVLVFAGGDFEIIADEGSPDFFDTSDPSTAIDQMIEICSSPCLNCGEAQRECQCAEYVFAGEHGHYEPRYRASAEEMDLLMDHISPSYRYS